MEIVKESAAAGFLVLEYLLCCLRFFLFDQIWRNYDVDSSGFISAVDLKVTRTETHHLVRSLQSSYTENLRTTEELMILSLR